VNTKPVTQINAKKWQKLKLILKNLRERGSLASSEIGPIIFGPSMNNADLRTLQNYLAELIGIGLVSFDSISKQYTLVENKREFKSKADYGLALKHSKGLILSSKSIQGPEHTDPVFFLRRLAYVQGDRKNWEKVEHDVYLVNAMLLLQHFKSGYPEIIQLIESYRETAYRIGIRSDHPHLAASTRLGGPTKQNSAKDAKELDDIVDIFTGKISRLIRETKDGIPLAGSCDGCPSRKITVPDV
jgi:hypothetical protein